MALSEREAKEEDDVDQWWLEPDEDSEPDEFEEAMSSECGQGEGGLCTLAGTEYCDFECPFRD